MALVVFLRAANVGGHNAFKPAQVAKQLAHLEVTNLGAAGTFIVRARVAQAALRKELAEALPFEAATMIVPGKAVRDLVASEPFADLPEGVQGFVSVLSKKLRKVPSLPLDAPATGAWQVRLTEVRGPFALAQRRAGPGRFYPQEFVEKALGVPATTRGWATFDALAERLEA